jgi:EEF1A lysine methyltransferase 1
VDEICSPPPSSSASSAASADAPLPTPFRGRCAFLSTPSLYFSIPADQRAAHGHMVFDFDRDSFGRDPRFVFYDFNAPTSFGEGSGVALLGGADGLKGAFDLVVIDPPFITEEVWAKYAETARYLLKGWGEGDGGATAAAASSSSSSSAGGRGRGHAICTTVAENRDFLARLFPGLARQRFQPSIPNLVYQYDLYATWTKGDDGGGEGGGGEGATVRGTAFGAPNPEIPE